MRPLDGRRVVVTRAADQAEAMLADLAERGAQPLLMPCIATIALSTAEVDAALDRIAGYDWIVLTSTNAVRFLFDRLPPTALAAQTRFAVVGTATAQALESAGLCAAAMPAEFTGTALAAAMGDLTDARILLPRSQRGREAIVTALREQGARVDDVATYDTVPIAPTAAMCAQVRAGVDAVTFTSPSTVEGFLAGVTPAEINGAVIAAIGPTTAQALVDGGLRVQVQPGEYTTCALVDALESYFGASTRR